MRGNTNLTPWSVVGLILAGAAAFALGLALVPGPTALAAYGAAVLYLVWLARSGQTERARSLFPALAYPTYLVLRWLWQSLTEGGT